MPLFAQAGKAANERVMFLGQYPASLLASMRMRVEVVSLLPIQAVDYVGVVVAAAVARTLLAFQLALVAYRADVDVRADVATSVAQAQDALLAFQMALVASPAGVDHLLPAHAMNDVREDVATAVAQVQDALLAFQMAVVASRAGVDHLDDVLYLQKIARIDSSRRHERNLAVRILRLLFFAYLPSSYQ